MRTVPVYAKSINQYWLAISARDRDEHFSRKWKRIDIVLDDVVMERPLWPSFWTLPATLIEPTARSLIHRDAS